MMNAQLLPQYAYYGDNIRQPEPSSFTPQWSAAMIATIAALATIGVAVTHPSAVGTAISNFVAPGIAPAMQASAFHAPRVQAPVQPSKITLRTQYMPRHSTASAAVTQTSPIGVEGSPTWLPAGPTTLPMGAAWVLNAAVGLIGFFTAALGFAMRGQRQPVPHGPLRICTVAAEKVDEEKAVDDFEATAKEVDAQFSWTKQWWPLHVTEIIDKTRPHSAQLLGKELVIWWDKNGANGAGAWRVFEDACPHRLAPLSEGRIEDDGNLLCAYHAWRFDGEGKCVALPQADPANHDKLCSLPKACAKAHPAQELQGILWVWGEAGDPGSNVAFEANLKAPRLIPELVEHGEDGRGGHLPWSMRDMPYGWDYFMENVMDPAHVAVSHHGIVGNRYTGAKPVTMKLVRPPTADEGFKFALGPPPTEGVKATYNNFQPPCLQHISSEYEDGSTTSLVLYATPTRPGYVRHIGCQSYVKTPEGKKPGAIVGPFGLPFPKWFLHVMAPLFLHQDMVFLHHQEKILAARGYTTNGKGAPPKDYVNSVFTPTQADKMIIYFRKWITTFAGGAIAWAPGTPELPYRESDKSVLFDTYHAHTKHCQYCLQALKNITRIRNLAIVLGILRLGLGDGPWRLIVAFVCFGLAAALQKFKGLFYKYEFEHADNH
mmetsp:Transcript_11955/g.21705  ORF Transcript_11955/g.21705 Transcript_11955/m.21705 type:complete len:658 (-) Transcript_11955:1360-3333(-)